MQDSTQEAIVDAVKASPPVAVTISSWLSSLEPDKLLVWATLIYTLLLISHHCWKNLLAPWFSERRRKREARRRRLMFGLHFDDEEDGA